MSPRKILVWILAPLVALYGVYVVGANVFLNTDLAFELINRKPEKMHIQWSSGSSFWPGVVNIEDFQIRGQSRKLQWFCAMPGGTFHLDLLALASREVVVRKGRGRGFEFRSRRRLSPEEASSQMARWQPEIPGFSNPPDPAPEDIYPPGKKRKKNPWHLKIGQVDLEGPIHLWFSRMRIEGHGRLGGSMDYLLGHEMEISGAFLDLDDARFLIDSAARAEQLDITLDAAFEPFVLGETKGLDILGFLRADLAIPSAVVPDLTVFSGLFPSDWGLSLASGSASLVGRLSVAERGAAEGEFTLRGSGVEIASLDDTTRGDLELVTRLREGDLVEGIFDISGTRLRLKNVVASGVKRTRKEPWWAGLEFRRGIVDVGRPMTMEAIVELELKDTKPLVALFGAKAMPNIRDLRGTVELEIDAEMVVLEPMEFSGRSLVVLGRLGIAGGRPRGSVYVKYLGIPIAVELTEEGTRLVVRKPLRWFEAQPPIR